MKRIGLPGLGLVVLLAASAVAAGSASAAAPEFGRCVKLTGERTGIRETRYHGGYHNASCTEASPEANGRYEWYPGAVKTHFTTTIKSGTAVAVTVVGRTQLACTGETSTGEYTSPKLEEHVVVTLTGCQVGGAPAASAEAKGGPVDTAPGEVVLKANECELGVVARGETPAKDKLGLTCAEEQEFAWIKWARHGYEGIGEYELGLRGWWFFTTAANRIHSQTTVLNSAQSNGMQKIDKFVEGPLEPLESTLNGGLSWEPTVLTLTTVQTNEEDIEANSVA
jgi:hypothetical protein